MYILPRTYFRFPKGGYMLCPNYRVGSSCGSCKYGDDRGVDEVAIICTKSEAISDAVMDKYVDFHMICDWYEENG